MRWSHAREDRERFEYAMEKAKPVDSAEARSTGGHARGCTHVRVWSPYLLEWRVHAVGRLDKSRTRCGIELRGRWGKAVRAVGDGEVGGETCGRHGCRQALKPV